jgi:hypothetical protein
MALQTLLTFLNEIAKNHKINQMTRTNLAVCFSPSIFSLNSLDKKLLKNKRRPMRNFSMPDNPSNLSRIPPSNSNNKVNFQSIPQKFNSIQLNKNTGLLTVPVPSIVTTNLNYDANNKNNSTNQTSSSNSSILISDNEMNNNNNNIHQIESFNFKPEIETVSPSNLSSYNKIYENISSNLSTSSTSIQQSQQQHQQMNIYNQIQQQQQQPPSTSSSSSLASSKINYKRKASETINKAASSLANFGAELSSSTSSAFGFSSANNSMIKSKVKQKKDTNGLKDTIQICVADMIKYSMELFSVIIHI